MSPIGYDAEVLEKAQSGFNNFLSWASPLSSRRFIPKRHWFPRRINTAARWTISALLAANWLLVDWKTSEGVFPEMLIQLAAYGAALA